MGRARRPDSYANKGENRYCACEKKMNPYTYCGCTNLIWYPPGAIIPKKPVCGDCSQGNHKD